MDRFLGGVLLIAGLLLFISGFRFLNPLDTAFRILFGATAVVFSIRYIKAHRLV
ncbi:MAG: hypothetical protein WA095_03575 [Minisyncoccia bacterium]